MFLAPGNGPRSSRQTFRPARASASAAHAPAGPAPTTIASKSTSATESLLERVEHGIGVAHDGEVGELHHRAVCIGVHAHDVIGSPEPTRVLDGAADPERDVELRIDDHARGADLTNV